MTELDIFISLTQNLTSNIASFKSGEKDKKEFNKEMIIQVILLLNIQNELEKKNKEIKKKQDLELEKIFKIEEERKNKIKLIKKKVDDSSEEEIEDDDNPLYYLINPTLQSYIPMSQISICLENKFENNENNKLIMDENCLFNKKIKDNKTSNLNNNLKFDKDYTISNFEEASILSIKNKLYNKQKEYESYINLIEKNDNIEYYFLNEKNIYELNSFNEINFNINDKNEKLNFEKDYNLLINIIHERTLTTSIGGFINISNSNLNETPTPTFFKNKNYRTDSFNNEYESQFKNHLNLKNYNYYTKYMNSTYLRKMLDNYNKINSISQKTFLCEDKMFINLTKIFLLKRGISDKKLYEDTLRNLVYKGHRCNFENYLNCFLKILKLSDDNLIIKYKFLLYLMINDDDEKISLNQLKEYYNQMLCNKLIYDEDICSDIAKNLVNKYNSLYKGNYTDFSVRNILLVLETFFEHK